MQLDGGDSINDTKDCSNDSLTIDDNDDTDYSTDDEIEQQTTTISISPPSKPNKRQLEIVKVSSLPLVAALNARSLYNKHGSFKIISEMWEREIQPLDKLLKMTAITILSYCRQSQSAMMGKQ